MTPRQKEVIRDLIKLHGFSLEKAKRTVLKEEQEAKALYKDIKRYGYEKACRIHGYQTDSRRH